MAERFSPEFVADLTATIYLTMLVTTTKTSHCNKLDGLTIDDNNNGRDSILDDNDDNDSDDSESENANNNEFSKKKYRTARK